MRIAQIAPLFESVPPQKYGGTERVISYLTEELVADGHEVTLFASGDSVTSAELVPGCHRSLRLHEGYEHSAVPHMVMMEEVKRRAREFDILHFHTDYLHYPLVRGLDTPHVTTMHGRMDFPQYSSLYREFKDIPLISISNAQRAPLPWANWAGTIYHGLPKKLYRPRFELGKYAAFLGRISPEKRPDRAIDIANRAGIHLKMAAKVDVTDREYFETTIRPMIEASRYVEFIGEITDEEKNEFLGNAAVLLSPIDWPEPFGLVFIEAMACGTPVISYPHGSAPEVITEGVSGFLVNSVAEAVEKIQLLPRLDRARVFHEFEKRFSVRAMREAHLSVYEDVCQEFSLPHLSLLEGGAQEWKTFSSLITKSI
jgi:glycosyltransferase involved in cell wall biosynthesis